MGVLLLLVHIALMTASLITTSSMVIAAAFSYGTPAWLIKANYIGTLVGVLAGIVLLFTQPLDMRCLVLAGYLFAFGLAHVYVRRKMATLVAVSSTK